MQIPFLILKLKGRVFITAFFVDPEKQKSRGAPSRGPPRLYLYGKGSAVAEPLLDRPPPIIVALYLFNHNYHIAITFKDFRLYTKD